MNETISWSISFVSNHFDNNGGGGEKISEIFQKKLIFVDLTECQGAKRDKEP